MTVGIWLGLGWAAFAQADGGPIELQGGRANLTLSREMKGSVVSFRSRTGQELAAGEQKGLRLFTLSFSQQAQPTGAVFLASNHDAAAFSAELRKEADGSCSTLTYEGFPQGVARVACTVRTRPGDALTRWGIRIEMQDGWVLEKVQYPCVTLAAKLGVSDEDDAAVVGSAKGGVISKPGAMQIGRRPWFGQPGTLAAAFGCYYDDRAGFYTAAEDAKGHPKELAMERTKAGVEFSWSRFCCASGADEQAYDVVTACFEGAEGAPAGWRDAADLYKQWAWKQHWCATPFAQREDLPGWLREGAAMVRFNREWLAEPERIERWVQEVWLKHYSGIPLITAYWGWEKLAQWVTPDYFPAYPSDAQFTNLVAKTRKLGCHAFPWPSGYHWTLTYNKRADGGFEWDDRARFDRVARSHAVHNRDGSLYLRVPRWLNGGNTACLCGGDPWTIRWWNKEVCAPLVRRGCELIQVDQVVGADWPACYASGHGHPRGRGLWMTEAFTRQLLTMRETMRKGETDSVVCFEEPNEGYNHIVGLQDYRDCEAKQEWASVFNYLYHEYLPPFQSNPRGNDRVMIAHCAADGQMPHLVPSERDFGGTFEALVNGGFEATSRTDAMHGWGQVRDYQGQVWTGQATVDTAEKHDGASSLRLDNTNRDDVVQVAQNVTVSDTGFLEGGTYRLSAWMKTGHMAVPGAVNFIFLSQGVKSAGQGGRLAFPAAGGGWVRVSSEFTVPDGAEMLRIMCTARGAVRIWIDGVTLEAVRPDGTTQDVRTGGRSADARFMEKWAALYHGEGRPWLLNGRLLHPPKLTCATLDYRDRKVPAVFHNAFQAPDGQTAVVLANATRKPQTVTLAWRGKPVTLTLDGSDVVLVR